jgi:hypothetical protein
MTTAIANRRGDPAGGAIAVNFIAFQAGWFACVLGAAAGRAWIGPVVVGAALALHFARSTRPMAEIRLALCALAIGLAWDGALLHLGMLEFAAPGPFEAMPPAWMLALWPLFASTLNVSLRWLRRRPLAAAALGAAAGPLSYWAGARLGALGLPEPGAALALLAVGWAAITPLLLALARRFDEARMPEGGR